MPAARPQLGIFNSLDAQYQVAWKREFQACLDAIALEKMTGLNVSQFTLAVCGSR
jgi:hypothetical protein